MVVMWKRERCEDGNGDEGDRGSGVWVLGMEHAKKKGRGLKDLNRFFFSFLCKAGSVHFWTGSEANSTHSSVPGIFHYFSRIFGHFFRNYSKPTK